ncbi:pyrroline-5-carboxylate reductase [Natronomonas pharaonis DSM 2160]|uniref:Pyrroline-5-carboxylate reductase n=1 Tax=Natronomonas pharaonis (strain ATCC 35678 / DSM 2160 / CIP 103997 / JCM 8858 / NBRC 14720 / NCIMB 2260 / Gabara) TaxID=348780 RepID=A0A1U7EY06_NATPD|nr:pyrroline-5-carboxylate reductase [Natronomonas pharaonis]CAI50078.1 pyrroline-5-carboxylate reductase [Natronomonas pharaonis DSM 2160]
MTSVSVIGCGNMGGALLRGLAESGNYTLTACDLDPEAREAVEEYAETTDDPAVAADADIVVVAVKPHIARDVVDDIELSSDQTLVTIAAGVSTDALADRTDATVVRVMPNLAAETRNMAAAVTESTVTDDVRSMLDDVGEFVDIDEELMDIATAVNGSGPAFVFYLIDAMRQAGVESGLDDEDARVLAAQTFKGAAETVLRSDEDIETLIDAVCSPNGTTIEGMDVLWDSDADEAVVDAVAAAERRSKELADESDDE